MRLETERLLIHPITEKDIQQIHNLHCTKEIAAFNTLGIPTDIAVTERLLEAVLADNDKEFGWTIWEKETNYFIGELGMGVSPEVDRGEIHYALLPAAWGNGYAAEAVKEIIKFGFEALRLQSIEANTPTKNIRSIKLLERVGMTKQSIQQKTLLIGDDWFDNYTFALAQPDTQLHSE